MTLSTLNQVTTYLIKTPKKRISKTSSVKEVQDRNHSLNRELLAAIAKADLGKSQNPNSTYLIDISEQTAQNITSITAYNLQQQISIYMNVSDSTNNEADKDTK